MDKLMACGKLDHLKNGPIYWVDSADTNPCMGEVIGLYHVSTVQKKTLLVKCCSFSISFISPLLFYFSPLSPPPPIATASSVMWKIHVKGRLFHSGLPHKGINSIELASEAMAYIQQRFYEDFPPVSL